MKCLFAYICMFALSTAALSAQEEKIREAKSLIEYIQKKAPWSYVIIGISVIVFAVVLNRVGKLFKGKKKEEE